MQKLSYFHFVKQLLLHPLKLADTYFEDEKSPAPYLRKYAWYTYIGVFMLNFLIGGSKEAIKNDFVIGGLVALLPSLLVIFAVGYLLYVIYCWFIKKVFTLSGATIANERMEEIALFQLSFSSIFSACFTFVTLVIATVLPLLESSINVSKHSMMVFIGFFASIASLLGFIYVTYVSYHLVREKVGVNPLKVLAWGVLLILLFSIAISICLFGLLVILGALA